MVNVKSTRKDKYLLSFQLGKPPYKTYGIPHLRRRTNVVTPQNSKAAAEETDDIFGETGWLKEVALIIKKVLGGSFATISIEEIQQKVNELVMEHSFRKRKLFYFSQLTRREIDVLSKLALGISNKEIAKQLYISIDTVKYHRKHIKSKLEASSIADMILYAKAFKLIKQDH